MSDNVIPIKNKSIKNDPHFHMRKRSMVQGFSVSFSNGVRVSIGIGEGHYCSNNLMIVPDMHSKLDEANSSDAEVAIIDSTGEFITAKYTKSEDGDSVIRNVAPDDIVHILLWAQHYEN